MALDGSKLELSALDEPASVEHVNIGGRRVAIGLASRRLACHRT
jgi:hypothetical protein